MPLTIKSGLITRFLHVLGECWLVAVKVVSIVHKTIDVAMFSRQDHRSTRTANRVRAKTVLKQHALSCETINIGRRIDRFKPTVISANGVRGVVVGEYEQNVGTFGRLAKTCECDGEAEQAGGKAIHKSQLVQTRNEASGVVREGQSRHAR